VFIFLAHNVVDLVQMAKGIGLGAWAAIEQFQTTTRRLWLDDALYRPISARV
jgi:hypothetical protein